MASTASSSVPDIGKRGLLGTVSEEYAKDKKLRSRIVLIVNESRLNSEGQGKYGVFAVIDGDYESFYNSTRWVNVNDIVINHDDVFLSLK